MYKLPRFIRISLIVYITYLAICLLLVMPALNIIAPRLFAQYTGRTLTTELILFNPFTLTVEARGAAIRERNGEHFAAFDLLSVNLGLQSLWLQHPALDTFVLRGLTLNLVRLDESTFNFSDLLPESVEDEEPESPPAAISVDRVEFHATRLSFRDQTRTPAYATALRDIRLDLAGLSTVVEEAGAYDLLLATEHSGVLHWKGELSLARASSSGSLQMANVDLRPVHRFFEAALPLSLSSAMLDVSGDYRASWKETPDVSVIDGVVQLRDVHMEPRDTAALPDTGIRLGALLVRGIELRSSAQTVGIAEVSASGLNVSGFSEGDRISLLEMVAPPAKDRGAVAVADATPPAIAAAETDSAWNIKLATFSLEGSALQWRSELLEPAEVILAPLRADVSDIGWPATEPSSFKLSVAANDRARVELAGKLHLGTGDGAISYALTALPLPWFNPLLDSFIAAQITDGDLAIEGEVNTAAFAPAQISASTEIDALKMTIAGRDSADLSWQSLQIAGTALDLPARDINLGTITLAGYRGYLHILPDGRLNAQLAVREQPAAPPEASTAETDKAPEASTAWAVGLSKLQLVDAQLDFFDESLPLPFRTRIEAINGETGVLRSDGKAPMPLDFVGSVDGYSPVTISGEVNPFAAQRTLDIGVSFTGIDIANLTPYSGTYAGYRIDSGTLNLNLRYQLDGDRLRGDNRAVIAQMKLGDAVESPKALDLPLRLALALLTDSRGIIDLDIPIAGSVDNPEFSIGKVVGRAIANVITKAVTAPFRLLANLVSSDENLEEIPFPGGSSELAAAGRERLGTLAEALQKRPQLSLVVTGSVDPKTDLQVLRENLLRSSLLAEGLSEEAIALQGEAWAAAVGERYRALVADQAPDSEPDTAQQLSRVLSTITVPEAARRELAAARGAAVKRYLVIEAGIAADRIAVGASKRIDLQGAKLDLAT